MIANDTPKVPGQFWEKLFFGSFLRLAGEMEPDEVWKAPGPFSLSGLAIRAGNPHFAAEW